MPASELDQLIGRVTAHFRKHAGRFGLNADTVEARYILNWGGFVNANFTVRDGQRAYHLKLAQGEEDQAPLRRWQSFHKTLSSRYRAPRMLGWVRIPGSDFAGPLFEFIPGRPANFREQPAVLVGVLDLLTDLHADQELAARLVEMDGPPSTCSDAFLELYVDRLDNDLLTIASSLPPFVPLPLLDWMMGETRELEGLARDLPAFQALASAPTHSDLYPNNILVTPAGDWRAIDWDDLALGDPALDYSILLGGQWREALDLAAGGGASTESGGASTESGGASTESGGAAADGAGLVVLPAAGLNALQAAAAQEEARLWGLVHPSVDEEDMRARFSVCLRALLLDEVIDSLADWVEAAFAPQHMGEVRAAKERAHRAALDLYRALYPGS